MIPDRELDTWRREWNTLQTDVPDLADLVRRQSFRMRLVLAAEVAVTVGIGGGTVLLAIISGERDVWVLALATWTFIAFAWGFSIWNRKGAWRPAAQTTSEYLAVSIRRCETTLRSLIFGVALFAVEMVFCLGWIYHRTGNAAFMREPRMLGIWLASAIFLLVIAIYRKRKGAELTSLRNLQKEVQ